MPLSPDDPFQWRQYPGEVILLCVRWYLRFPLSYAHVAEMMQERGLAVDRSCVWRWVQDYAPEINRRCRPHLKPVGRSWRVDETFHETPGVVKQSFPERVLVPPSPAVSVPNLLVRPGPACGGGGRPRLLPPAVARSLRPRFPSH